MTTAGKGNLPVEYTSLAGRAEEIAEGLLGLSESRLVTVTGPGGVGKSRVATRVAHGARRRFPDGVWYAELSHVADERSLVAAVAATMGRPELTTAEEVADAFAGWRALLVLDTCEHLMGPVSRLVEAVLRGTGTTKVLAVSRVLLTVPGQRVLTVGPLPEHQALALLVERARAVDQGFELTEATRPFAEEICRSLEGVPLAIELAAGCLRSLPLAELLERMDDRWPDLAGSSTNVLARQRDLRSLVEWSHALCGAEQRVLWEALSVLSGSFPWRSPRRRARRQACRRRTSPPCCATWSTTRSCSGSPRLTACATGCSASTGAWAWPASTAGSEPPRPDASAAATPAHASRAARGPAQPEGGAGRHPHRRGADQSADRQQARDLQAHGGRPRSQHPRQEQPGLPHPRGRLGDHRGHLGAALGTSPDAAPAATVHAGDAGGRPGGPRRQFLRRPAGRSACRASRRSRPPAGPQWREELHTWQRSTSAGRATLPAAPRAGCPSENLPWRLRPDRPVPGIW
ncbi:NB-ARC domain-containing protein [Nonomuraea recticatena]